MQKVAVATIPTVLRRCRSHLPHPCLAAGGIPLPYCAKIVADAPAQRLPFSPTQNAGLLHTEHRAAHRQGATANQLSQHGYI